MTDEPPGDDEKAFIERLTPKVRAHLLEVARRMKEDEKLLYANDNDED